MQQLSCKLFLRLNARYKILDQLCQRFCDTGCTTLLCIIRNYMYVDEYLKHVAQD